MKKGGKARPAPWRGVLRGTLAALVMYLVGTALLALLIVKGAVSEGVMFPVTAVLCALLVYIANADPVLACLLSWADMAIVALGLLALGVLICTLASLLATNRYLSAQYDDMFMK